MKKKWIALSMALAMTLGTLTGCGGTTSSSGTTESTADATVSTTETGDDTEIVATSTMIGNPNGTIELNWMPCPSQGPASTITAVAETVKAHALEWAKEHPDVKINVLEMSANSTEAMAKLLTQAAAGTAPDAAGVDSSVLASFYDYLQPIDDGLESVGVSVDDFFPFAQAGMVHDGKVVAYWYTTDVRVLFYRNDLVQTPPKDWDELLETAKSLSSDTMMGLIYPAGRNEATICDFLPYFWAQGGELVDEEGTPIFGEGDNRQYMINALDFIGRTVSEGASPARVTQYNKEAEMVADIAAGNVAMFVGGNYAAQPIREAMGKEEFDSLWEATAIPQKDPNTHSSTSGGWTTGVFTQDEEKRALLADFLAHIYVEDQALSDLCEAVGNLPARQSLFDSAEFLKTDKFTGPFKEMLLESDTRPAVDSYSVISQELQIAINNVITGSMTAEEATDNAFSTVLSSL